LAKRELLLYRYFLTEGNSIFKTTLFVWFIIGCFGPTAFDPGIAINPTISECGGFPVSRSARLDHGSSTSEFCNDDMLHWQYNEKTQTVTLTNDFVWLNCCGVRSISVYQTAYGRYEFRQTDEPAPEGRCDCECSFDYQVDISPVSKSIDLDIVRNVSDATPTTWTAWSGGIDLTENTGEILIEADVGWCF
jgi:hypothetical protein